MVVVHKDNVGSVARHPFPGGFASEVEAEFFNPTEFLDQIVGSPRTARELIQRLSQRSREADDRIANDERRTGQANDNRKRSDTHTAVAPVLIAHLAAKSEWLQHSFPHRSGSASCRLSLANLYSHIEDAKESRAARNHT